PAQSQASELCQARPLVPLVPTVAPQRAFPWHPPVAAQACPAADECSQRHGPWVRDRTCCRLRPLALLNFRESLRDRLVLKLGAHFSWGISPVKEVPRARNHLRSTRHSRESGIQ